MRIRKSRKRFIRLSSAGVARVVFLTKKNKKKSNSVYSHPLYKKWRKRVFKRDGFKCILCGRNDYIEAHHIFPKSMFPELMLVLSNGVTLCGPANDKKSCHGKITGREMDFANSLRSFTSTKDPKWLSFIIVPLKIKKVLKNAK